MPLARLEMQPPAHIQAPQPSLSISRCAFCPPGNTPPTPPPAHIQTHHLPLLSWRRCVSCVDQPGRVPSPHIQARQRLSCCQVRDDRRDAVSVRQGVTGHRLEGHDHQRDISEDQRHHQVRAFIAHSALPRTFSHPPNYLSHHHLARVIDSVIDEEQNTGEDGVGYPLVHCALRPWLTHTPHLTPPPTPGSRMHSPTYPTSCPGSPISTKHRAHDDE